MICSWRAEADRPESGDSLLPPLSEEQRNCKYLHDGLLHNRGLEKEEEEEEEEEEEKEEEEEEKEEEEVDISQTLYEQHIKPRLSVLDFVL